MSEFSSRLKNDEIDFLFEAILSLKTLEECYRFFEDVCTISEIKSIAQRLEVAAMLKERRTYIDIAQTTGASTATISRVNRSLNYGNNGYDIAFERIKENNNEKE